MTELHESAALIRLAVDDARTAQDTGARFAAAMADVGSADFMVTLAEQLDVIRRAITDAGFTAEQAWLAAEHFEIAVRDELERIADASTPNAWGHA